MGLWPSIAKLSPFKSPLVKYGVLAFALMLWSFGLVDQLYSSAATMKYILMSILIAAVAVI